MSISESIDEIRYLTGAGEVDLQSMFALQPRDISSSQTISRKYFLQCFKNLSDIVGDRFVEAEVKIPEKLKLLNLIFNVYDEYGKDEIALYEFASCLSLLCTGDFRENLLLIFELLDDDDDGYVADTALLKYISSVCKLLFQLSKSGRERIGTTIESFACDTWYHILDVVERKFSHQGMQSFEEFYLACLYFTRTGYNGFEDGKISSGKHDRSLKSTIECIDMESEYEDVEEDDTDEGDGIAYFDTVHPMDDRRGVGGEIEGDQDDRDADVDESSEAYDSGGFDRLVNLKEARKVLGLSSQFATDIVEVFCDLSDFGGSISLTAFQRGISLLVNQHYVSLSPTDRKNADFIINSIFPLFDEDDCGYCDVRDLCTAITLYAGGDSRNKAQALFHLLMRFSPPQLSEDEEVESLDVDNIVAPERMASCITSLFKAAKALDSFFLIDKEAVDLATEITVQVFAANQLELYREDRLPQAQFELHMAAIYDKYFDWQDPQDKKGDIYQRSSLGLSPAAKQARGVTTGGLHSNATLSLAVVSPSGGETRGNFSGDCRGDRTDDDSGDEYSVAPTPRTSKIVEELRAARLSLGLASFPAEDLIDTLSEYSQEGSMSERSFVDVMQLIARLEGLDDASIAECELLVKKIFAFFDPKHSGAAAYAEMAAGLSGLCESPFEDKVMVSFTLMDDDGDQRISIDELRLLVLSHLRVVAACSASAAEKILISGVGLNALAKGVTEEAVRAYEHENLVSLESFTIELVSQIAGECLSLANGTTRL